MAERRATVTWEGTLTAGKGTVSLGSGALTDAPVTWASRTERADGKTSPEELLAAAHAECYAMGLSNTLSGMGKTPTSLEVEATCTVEKSESGLKITGVLLDVSGDVDVDARTFTQTAEEAERTCPVSNALRGNVEIRVQARLRQLSGKS